MMTYTTAQPRRADGIIARLLIIILLLIVAFLVYDRFTPVLPRTPAAVEAPALATLPADYLSYTETDDPYQTDPAVINARRRYVVEQRLGCAEFDRDVIVPGVDRVTCKEGQ